MRATITVLLIILQVFILGCTLNQQAPTQDMEARMESKKEIDKAVSATVQAKISEERTVSATMEALLKKQNTHNPTAVTPATPISTIANPTPEPLVEEKQRTENLPTTPNRPIPTKPHAPSTLELDRGTRTPPTPIHSPTAKDAIPEWGYENHPSLTEYILNLPWTSGTLTAFELNTIELLIRYAVIHSNGIESAINEHLIAEPDPFAIDIIQEFGSFEHSPEVADPRQIKVERRLINLPLHGQTNLLILRAQPGSKVAMDLLENAVRSAERFMGVPFPTDQVTLRFTKRNVEKGYDGSFNPSPFAIGRIQILPTHDQHALVTTHYSPGNEKRLAEIIAHEVAHYYWHHHVSWINEGMAETLEAYIENDRVGTPIASSRPPCSAD